MKFTRRRQANRFSKASALIRALVATFPYGAPHRASASPDINASANDFTMARNRSGDADSRYSRRNAAASTLTGAVIAWSVLRHLFVSKDQAMMSRLTVIDAR